MGQRSQAPNGGGYNGGPPPQNSMSRWGGGQQQQPKPAGHHDMPPKRSRFDRAENHGGNNNGSYMPQAGGAQPYQPKSSPAPLLGVANTASAAGYHTIHTSYQGNSAPAPAPYGGFAGRPHSAASSADMYAYPPPPLPAKN